MGWLNGRVDGLAREQREEFIAQQHEQSCHLVVVLFMAVPLLLLITGVRDVLMHAPSAWQLVPWRAGLACVTTALALGIRRRLVGDNACALMAVAGTCLINLGLMLSVQAEPERMSLMHIVLMLMAMLVLPLTVRTRHTYATIAVLVLPLLPVLVWRYVPVAVWWATLATTALGVWAGLFMRRQRLAAALELFELRNRLEMRVDLDMLTGLFNREGWFRSAREVFTLTRNTRRPLSLAYLDLDHFKRINDEHGHAAGDDALMAVAEVMRRNSRRQDILGRLGGEEFVLLMPGLGEQAAVQLVQGLCEAVRAIAFQRSITFSAGVCQVRTQESLEDAIRRADHALLQAKRDGRDRVLRAS